MGLGVGVYKIGGCGVIFGECRGCCGMGRFLLVFFFVDVVKMEKRVMKIIFLIILN